MLTYGRLGLKVSQQLAAAVFSRCPGGRCKQGIQERLSCSIACQTLLPSVTLVRIPAPPPDCCPSLLRIPGYRVAAPQPHPGRELPGQTACHNLVASGTRHRHSIRGPSAGKLSEHADPEELERSVRLLSSGAQAANYPPRPPIINTPGAQAVSSESGSPRLV